MAFRIDPGQCFFSARARPAASLGFLSVRRSGSGAGSTVCVAVPDLVLFLAAMVGIPVSVSLGVFLPRDDRAEVVACRLTRRFGVGNATDRDPGRPDRLARGEGCTRGSLR